MSQSSLLFHLHFTIHRLTALTFFDVALKLADTIIQRGIAPDLFL